MVVRSLTWPGAFTLYCNGQMKSIYVGEGTKYEELRPFPLMPPVLILDPTEYGEFVLPEVKVLTPEEIKAKISACYDELWDKLDADKAGHLGAEALKKLAGELKAKINDKEEAMEVNEEAFDAALEPVAKDEDGNVTKVAAKAFLMANVEKL